MGEQPAEAPAFGLMMSRAGIAFIFDEGSKFKELSLSELTGILSYGNVDPTKAKTYNAYAYSIMRLFIENNKSVTAGSIDILTVGEIFPLMLPPGFRVTHPRRKYASVWLTAVSVRNGPSYLRQCGSYTYNFTTWKASTVKPPSVTDAHWTALLDPRLEDTNIETWYTAFGVQNTPYNGTTDPTEGQLLMSSYLNLMCSHNLDQQYTNLAHRLLIMTFMAFAKRGECTAYYIRKNTQGFEGWFPQQVEISQVTMRSIYQIYGSENNDENMRRIVNTIRALLPTTAIRAINTLMQTEWSGMTAYRVIYMAINTHPRFYWQRLRSIGVYATEFNQFLAAVRVVRGNKYYGYKRDLGPAKSTEFPNLASVCAKLLTICDGVSTLDGLRSTSPRFRMQDQITAWITQYDTSRIGANADQIPADDGKTVAELQVAEGVPAP